MLKKGASVWIGVRGRVAVVAGSWLVGRCVLGCGWVAGDVGAGATGCGVGGGHDGRVHDAGLRDVDGSDEGQ